MSKKLKKRIRKRTRKKQRGSSKDLFKPDYDYGYTGYYKGKNFQRYLNIF